MNNKNIIITILISALVGGGAFYAGTRYQQSQRGRFQNNNFNRPASFRPVNGEIIAVDDKSITVKMSDGSSKIILLSAKTEISKSSPASQTELKTGIKVTVVGSENSDRSVTAQNIRL